MKTLAGSKRVKYISAYDVYTFCQFLQTTYDEDQAFGNRQL